MEASPNADTTSRGWLGTLLACLLLALTYGSLSAVGSFLLRGVDSHLWSIAPYLGVPWLPAGIGVAGLLIGGVRLWPAIFVTSACIWVGLVRLPWFAGLVDCAGITLGYVTTVRLMDRWGFGRRFYRYEDPLLLIGAAAVGILIVEAAAERRFRLGKDHRNGAGQLARRQMAVGNVHQGVGEGVDVIAAAAEQIHGPAQNRVAGRCRQFAVGV